MSSEGGKEWAERVNVDQLHEPNVVEAGGPDDVGTPRSDLNDEINVIGAQISQDWITDPKAILLSGK